MALGDGVPALASLGVCFGGFSPTAMDRLAASKEYVVQVEKIQAQRKAMKKRKLELDLARTTGPFTYVDSSGTKWTYLVIDGTLARITACETEAVSLAIPEEIEGKKVYALGADACSKNDFIQEVICPDSIEFIESCAFRYCPCLKRAVLPKGVIEYSATWFSHCPSLEELVLPGGLDVIGLSVFDNPGLKRLHIGKNVREIEPGAFQKTQLDYVGIDVENPFLMTDGDAIYTKDGEVLLALARPVSSYDVIDGCRAIGKKAAYNLESLRDVSLPDTVEILGEFAFSHSGLERFCAPSSLRVIDVKAFFCCSDLVQVTLNEGIERICDSAFEEAGIAELHIPGTIRHIGVSVTARTNVVHAGPDCTLTIDPSSELLFLDGEGGLYRRDEDGVHMIQLVDREAEEFEVFKGTSVVDGYAFAHHGVISRVVIPEGVVEVGKSAFRCCGQLESVVLPDSIATIKEDAFLDTNLASFRVPASLVTLGENALVTSGAHHGDQRPSLHHVEVAPGNDRFFVACGMLCERKENGVHVVVFTSSEPHVVFPPEIEYVDAYAFNNARGIEYLELNPGLRLISTSGLSTWCWIELIHIEVAEPVEGRTSFDFRFPNTRKGIHSISQGIGGATWVNVPGIMAQYDNCIVHAHDYNSPRNPDSISIYEQITMIMPRLKDPILLTTVNRNMFERLLRLYIVEICVDIARHDDRALMSDLLDFGFLNGDNIEQVIKAVGRLQDAAMTGYLLEVKRLRFSRPVFDFDL